MVSYVSKLNISRSMLIALRTYKAFVFVIFSLVLIGNSSSRVFASQYASLEMVSTTQKPNIVFILADDLGYGELGSYGQSIIQTPNIDGLAAAGVRFTQHYSGSPVCAPARAAFLTGIHTGFGQIRDNFELGGFQDEQEHGQMPLALGTFTISHMLKEAGYSTAVIGKWGLGGPGSEGVPSNHGFDLFFGYLDQKQAHNYYPTHLWRNDDRVDLDNEWIHPHQEFVGDPKNPNDYEKYVGRDYSVDYMTEEALKFIQENWSSPFFLFLAYPLPHVALQVPKETLVRYEGLVDESGPYLGEQMYLPHQRPRAAYAAMISTLDDHVGQVLDLLSELDLEEETIVMFSSDNGPTYVSGVDVEYFDSTGGLRGLKGEVYEGGIRVPLIVRWTGKINGGRTSHQVSAAWDILPTLGDLLSLNYPENLDGLSILPALMNETTMEERSPLYWEYHGLWNGAQAVRNGRWKGVRLGGHSDVHARIELYDLQEDPSETVNLSDMHPEIVSEIAEIMNSRTRSAVEAWNFAIN